jgi:DNA-directed RNA polymerase specialized sigma24 family protein
MLPNQDHRFLSTHWSMVGRACDASDGQGALALEQICRRYWYPLYAYVRRSGWGEDEAQDVTQEFFAMLVEKHLLERADAGRGKFRSFLLGTLNHVMANRSRSARAQKRGGRAEHVPLEVADLESQYQSDPGASCAPERLFDKGWAEVVLARTLARLEAECDAGGRSGRFAAVKQFLLLDAPDESGGFKETAAGLGLSESAVRSLVYRLRERCRSIFREEVAETVERESDVEDEMRHLMVSLAAGT